MKKFNACADQYRPSILNVGILAIILFITTLFASPHVKAATMSGSYHMIANGRSYHIESPPAGKTFNENNFGTGFQYEMSRSYGSKWVPFVTSSAFNDSFNNLSYYVGAGEARRFFIKDSWHIDVGYFGFFMARKDYDDYKPFPGVLPVASVGTRNVSLNMTYIPDVGDQVAELVFFQLKISLE
ncbi:MAG: hypothetical protein OEY52_00775 [Gammaproteobacteria bacterium]|nr:hypothetical protein [Gammaproteobacteria bacterium]